MASDPVSYPNFGEPVRCKTCGETTYFPPSVAPRRRYCNEVCYANRPTPSASPALVIIRLLGGSHALAQQLKTTPRTVRAWSLHGIPSKYHFDLLKVAEGVRLLSAPKREVDESAEAYTSRVAAFREHRRAVAQGVTYDRLRETVAYGRAWRKSKAETGEVKT